MPLLQVRECPEDIYRKITERSESVWKKYRIFGCSFVFRAGTLVLVQLSQWGKYVLILSGRF